MAEQIPVHTGPCELLDSFHTARSLSAMKRLGAIGLLVVVVLVCTPRFNRSDRWLQGVTGAGAGNDSMHYVAMSDVFKGLAPAAAPEAPFTYRPLVPLLASTIPVSSMTAINLLNVTALWLGFLLLRALSRSLGVEGRTSMLLVLTCAVSFPVFYYGAIGYVDPFAIGVLAAGAYLIERDRLFLLAVVVFVGTFAKESIALLLPVHMIRQLTMRRPMGSAALRTAVLLACFLIASAATRELSVDPSPYSWVPSPRRFHDNVTRFRTWASFILSAGLPAFLASAAILLAVRQKDGPRLAKMLPWIAGMASTVVLFLFAILSAYSDGRFVWPVHVFAVPIASIAIAGRVADRKS